MYFAIQDFYAILLQTFQNIFSKLLLHSCFQQVFLEILHFQFQALLLFLLVKSRKTVWQLTAFFQKGKHGRDQHDHENQAHEKTHIALVFLCWD